VRALLKIILPILIFTNVKAQVLFYQDTYKGGITSDGYTYYGTNYLHADTINFQLHIPSTSTIRKAFLLSFVIVGNSSNPNIKDRPLILNFNNNTLVIDSSCRVANFFRCDYSSNSNYCWIVAKDVTNLTQSAGNKLITPCQGCLMIADTSRHYIYDGFILAVMYDEPTMPIVNPVIFLNNNTYNSNMMQALNRLNPIDNSKDVGLSIETEDVWAGNSVSSYTLGFSLNSSLGNYTLGVLDQKISAGIYAKTLPGSFYYENNTLFGLIDDTPDSLINKTDALTNIKNYIANGATTFSLTSTSLTSGGCIDERLGYILAYSSPCPPINNVPLQNYKLCSASGGVQLAIGSSGSTYSWYPSAALNSSTLTNPIANPTVTTNYIVTITDNSGCHHTEQHKVNVYALPKTDSIHVVNAICGGSLGTAMVTPAHNGTKPYLYNIGSGNQSSNVFNNLNSATYSLTITDSVGCTYKQAFMVKQINPANASFSLTPNPACINDLVYFTNSSGRTTLQWWSFGNNDTTNTQNPTHVFTDTGNYVISLIAWNNLRQCSDTITHTLIVKECPPDSINITAPNIFTPNGDGINEIWQPIIYNLGFTLNDFSLTIFDRWGLKVFESTATNKGWDGKTTSGTECSEGTYYYVLQCKAVNTKSENKKINLKGFLTLAQ